MIYKNLGNSDIKVSQLCLGTMTWGSQNSQSEANEQIEICLDHGINFLDTAEMYPTTPRSPETQGNTEEIIGNWFKDSKKRDKIILATKITGKGFSTIRNGDPISKKNIRLALDGSLRRLKTDYIDLYQLHWANRGSYHMRQNWNYDPSFQKTKKELEEIHLILKELDDLRKEGKIRSIGLSNETAWGTMQFLKIAEENNLTRIVSIQNEYSLLCRWFDLDLAELSHHEKIGLLCYSPLACGLLSGKYTNGNIPRNSRKSIYNDLGKRNTDKVDSAVKKFLFLSKKHNVDSCQLAIAFCLSRQFMTSVIFGSTNKYQLLNNIKSKDFILNKNLFDDLENFHKNNPAPF